MRAWPVLFLLLLLAWPVPSSSDTASFGTWTPQIIILITVDDWGQEQNAAVMGEPAWADTPYVYQPLPGLDTMAAGGVSLRHVRSAPACTASRAMLLTGQDCFTSGSCGGAGGSLPASTATFVDALEASHPGEWHKVHIGKWGGVGGVSLNPTDFGFDAHRGTQSNVPDYELSTDDDYLVGRSPPYIQRTYGAGVYQTDQQTDDFTDEIDYWRADGKKRFIWLSYNAPHTSSNKTHHPNGGSPWDQATNECASSGQVPGPTAEAEYTCFQEMGVYAVDKAAEAIAYLTPAERDKAFIIFVPDNGSELGWINSGEPLYGTTGIKATVYEPGVDVGGTFMHPRMRSSVFGTVHDGTLDFADITATILDAADATVVPVGYAPGGVSVLPMLLSDCSGGQCDAGSRPYLYSRNGSDERSVIDTSTRFKLHYDGTTSLLFDLNTDPQEKTDLCAGDCTLGTSGNEVQCQALADHMHSVDSESLMDCGGVASGGADPTDPLDLNIAASRIGKWWDPKPVEDAYIAAQAWQEYDVTCDTAPCATSATTGLVTLPFDDLAELDGTCTIVTTSTLSNLNCMISNAPDDVVLYIPAGTYTVSTAVIVARSDIVVRGAGHSTILNNVSNTGRQRNGTCDADDAGASIMSVCATGHDTAAQVDWTGGYSDGDTVLNVTATDTFPVGSWVMLQMDSSQTSCALVDIVRGSSLLFTHIAKVTARSPDTGAGTITLDRPLNFDYDESGCAGTVWTRARPLDPITGIGIEAMKMQTDATFTLCNEHQDFELAGYGGGVDTQHDPPGATCPTCGQSCDDLGWYRFVHFSTEHTAESWVVGVKFERGYQDLVRQDASARWWWASNDYKTSGLNVKDLAMGIGFQQVSDIVHENETVDDMTVGYQNQQGASGIVQAYNYFHGYDIAADDNCYEQGSDSTYLDRCEAEKAIFNHNYFARAILSEGNDLDYRINFADVWHSRVGKYITMYRNRNRSDGLSDDQCRNSNTGMIAFDKSGDNTRPAPYVNIIGNTALGFVNRPVPGSATCANINPLEGLNYQAEHLWMERNLYRITGGTTGGGDSAFNILDANDPLYGPDHAATTSFGTGENDHGGSNADPLSNANASAPLPAWSGLEFPVSLYRSTKPSWWCTEAETCKWDDVTQGIGAFGDDFGGTLCKLPAQIRFESGTCTTS